MGWLLSALGALGCLAWCGLHGVGALALGRVPRLPRSAHPPPATLPALSVVIPACNEVDTLEPACRSLLGQAYEPLEVILVDDRSTDGTGALVDRIAASDRRVTAIHVTDLPAGWLGKVNALRRGLERARGAQILFTDADVHFSADCLRDAVALMVDRGLDHLTLLPCFRAGSLLHRALVQAFFVGYVRRTGGARDPSKGATPFGFGAFNLVRRGAFEATAGFAWLRMEVLDDLALGALMKRSGCRSGFAVAPDALEVPWYGGLAGALRGFEKNAFGALAGYRWTRLVVLAAVLAWLTVAPALLLLPASAPLLRPLPVVALACLVAEAAVARARFGMPLLPGLLTPVTHLLMSYAMLRSGFACAVRGGILWRGTLYRLDDLRAGRRVSFP